MSDLQRFGNLTSVSIHDCILMENLARDVTIDDAIELAASFKPFPDRPGRLNISCEDVQT